MNFREFKVVLVFCALALLPVFGAPISGQLSIGGSDATVFTDALDFNCEASIITAMPCVDGTNGNFQVTTQATTGGFNPFIGDTGLILDLDNTLQPLNETFNLSSWITFSTNSNVVFDLTFIELGVFSSAGCLAAPSPGQVCTPEGIPQLVTAANPTGRSAYNLINTATGVTASFDVRGIVRDTSDPGGLPSLFTGTFSATFNGETYQSLLNDLATTGQVDAPYTAVFTATIIPEPGTVALMFSGFALIAVGAYRRRRK
jgi:hypothetical protein